MAFALLTQGICIKKKDNYKIYNYIMYIYSLGFINE